MAKKYLDVYLQDRLAGKLYSDNGTLSFSYDEVYLSSDNKFKLSSSLPLENKMFDHQVVEAFFSGLLPDERVREQLAKNLKISKNNTFSLLEKIGGECAGAVSLYPEGQAPSDYSQEPKYRVLNSSESHDVLTSLDREPMLAGEDSIRLSGAGAQDKLIISFADENIAIPLGSTPSAHIIKPAIKRVKDSVHNEYFCMKLASMVGLPTPKVEVYWLNKLPYYLVDRYDRYKNDEAVVKRLHQEDFCQALYFPPEKKYQSDGGPSLELCFDLLNNKIKSGQMAGKNIITFLQGVIFNFIIGNGDAHGKNFSILFKGEGEELAPFYDLLSTVIYEDKKMAMKIGGKYKFKDVYLMHFEKISEITDMKPSFIKSQILELSKKCVEKGAELEKELQKNKDTQSSVYADINKIISKHVGQISEHEVGQYNL